MKYKIEIWQYGLMADKYESNNLKDIRQWFSHEWERAYYGGGCAFHLSKGNKAYDLDGKIDFLHMKTKPAEPLIEDEKIRKAVRAWAEACCIEIVEITHSRKSFLRLMSAIAGDDEICIDRDIGQTLDERVYTIAELCGEEEE